MKKGGGFGNDDEVMVEQSTVENIFVVSALIVLLCLMFTPVYHASMLLTSFAWLKFYGNPLPIAMICVLGGILLFFTFAIIIMYKCVAGRKKLLGDSSILMIAMTFVSCFGLVNLIFGMQILSMSATKYNDFTSRCGSTADTTNYQNAWTTLYALRQTTGCANQLSVESCTGFEATDESNFLKSLEEHYACWGFCYLAPVLNGSAINTMLLHLPSLSFLEEEEPETEMGGSSLSGAISSPRKASAGASSSPNSPPCAPASLADQFRNQPWLLPASEWNSPFFIGRAASRIASWIAEEWYKTDAQVPSLEGVSPGQLSSPSAVRVGSGSQRKGKGGALKDSSALMPPQPPPKSPPKPVFSPPTFLQMSTNSTVASAPPVPLQREREPPVVASVPLSPSLSGTEGGTEGGSNLKSSSFVSTPAHAHPGGPSAVSHVSAGVGVKATTVLSATAPKSLFSTRNPSNQCGSMVANEFKTFGEGVGSHLFYMGISLIFVGVLAGFLKMLALCRTPKE